jgi:hypothetical protein
MRNPPWRLAALLPVLLIALAPAVQAREPASTARMDGKRAHKQPTRHASDLARLERAAAAGDLRAAERAGELLLERAGLRPDELARARALLRRAACAGSASAAQLLDEMREEPTVAIAGDTR